MKYAIAFIGVSFMLAFSAVAADNMPQDIRGTWVGMTNSAVIGTGHHHPGGKDGEVRFRSIEMTFIFEKQERRAFSGKHISSAHSEPLVGSFASDMKSGVMTDPDGSYLFKVLSNDIIEVCYTGSTGNNARSASCYEIRKKVSKP